MTAALYAIGAWLVFNAAFILLLMRHPHEEEREVEPDA